MAMPHDMRCEKKKASVFIFTAAPKKKPLPAFALHRAAIGSEPAVVARLLRRSGAALQLRAPLDSPQHPDLHGAQPLSLACRRGTSDDAAVARLLLDAGAPIEAALDCNSPLLAACFCGTDELVALLMERGANVSVTAGGKDALWFACRNGVHGPAIVRLLASSPCCLSASSLSCVASALSQSGPMVTALAAALPPSRRPTLPPSPVLPDAHCGDPVGAASQGLQSWGVAPSAKGFAAAAPDGVVAWAQLRSGVSPPLDQSSDDAFSALLRCSDTRLWIWASREHLMQQHPLSGDTVFHLLASPAAALSPPDKLLVLRDLCRHRRNPLLPNRRGHTALQLCRDPELRRQLASYSLWRPDWFVTQWFGPFFASRCLAFLLVCLRMGHPAMSRDVRLLVVSFMAAAECTHVLVPPPP